jgi:hypothetical protein
MGMRGTSLILNLPTHLAETLSGALGQETAEHLVVAIQEDLLDLVATWRRVGREREVVVLVDHGDDAALHRVARRGLTAERGSGEKDVLRKRALQALGNHRVVAVLDRPSPDYALTDVDSLLRRAHEGFAVVADLDGDWMALGVSSEHRAVLDGGASLEAFVEHALLLDVSIHALVPRGRIDSETALAALDMRIKTRRARASRSRRFLLAHSEQTG